MKHLPSRLTRAVVVLFILCGAAENLRATQSAPDQTPKPDAPVTSPVPPQEPIDLLLAAVQKLVDEGTLGPGGKRRLRRDLVEANALLNRGDVRGALRRLSTFARMVESLQRGGSLAPEQALPLLDGAAAASLAARRLLDVFQLPPGLIACDNPPPPVCLATATYHVGHGKHGGRSDGSAAAPFTSIDAALQHAAAVDACGVEVLVKDGTYAGDLWITRNTRILGESRTGVVIQGSVINQGSYRLEIDRATIHPAGEVGGIVGWTCPSTSLTRVLVTHAARWGVAQSGGTLSALGLEIRHTEALADDVKAGTSIFLTGGVQAALNLLTISHSGSAALVTTGGDTRALVSGFNISDTQVNPFFQAQLFLGFDVPPGFSAVEARNGATLLMHLGVIEGSQFGGLLVDDAQAHFRYGAIRDTAEVTEGVGPAAESRGGTNALVKSGGTLELKHFALENADLAGLLAFGGYATASHGSISGNTIGAAIFLPPADPGYTIDTAVQCVADGVSFKNNVRNLEASTLPVPDEPVGACHTVPFVCSWCQ